MGFGEKNSQLTSETLVLTFKENPKADLIQIPFHLKVLFIYVYTETEKATLPWKFGPNETRDDFEVGLNFDETEFIIKSSFAFQKIISEQLLI